MPNTIKYSTTGDTQSLKKGNFYIGVGDVPKGPSNTTGHWQGITPPTSGYTIYINSGSGSTAIMAPDSDAKLVAYANGMNNNTNYISNGGNFSNGTISPFNSLYNQVYGTSYVVNIANDKPYSGSNSNYAMFFNYGGGRMMGTDGMLTTGVTYTFSFWAKLVSGTTMNINWNNQNGSGETNAWTSSATLTTEWKRYIQTFTYNLPRTRFYFSTANPSNPERAAIFTEFQVSTGTTYGGPGLQNAAEALNWFASVSQDEVCVNRDYDPLITNGLTLLVDAGFTPSYPKTGTTIYDLSYSGSNGTLTNGPSYSGSNGGSLIFDGVDDYITFGSNGSNLIQNKTNITLGILFQLDVNNVLRGLVGTLAYGCGGNLGLVSSNGGLNFYNDYGPWPATGGTCYSIGISDYVTPNNWIYAVATYDGYTTKIYGIKNGTLSTTTGTTKTGTTNVFSRNFEIMRGGSYYSKGKVISSFVYDRVLSQSEIISNYQSLIPRLVNENIVTRGLSLYLDAGYTGSYPTTGTTWHNITGISGGTGTLTNGPTYNSSNGGNIVFDGTDDYVTTTNFYLSTLPATIIVWFKAGTQTSNAGSILRPIAQQGVFNASFPAQAQGIEINMIRSGSADVGKIRFSWGGDVDTNYQYLTTNRYDDNQWHFASIVNNGNTFDVYIDGIYLSTKNTYTSVSTSTPMNFGGDTFVSDRKWVGSISLIQIYDRSLSQTEILQNFNAQKSRFGL